MPRSGSVKDSDKSCFSMANSIYVKHWKLLEPLDNLEIQNSSLMCVLNLAEDGHDIGPGLRPCFSD